MDKQYDTVSVSRLMEFPNLTGERKYTVSPGISLNDFSFFLDAHLNEVISSYLISLIKNVATFNIFII